LSASQSRRLPIGGLERESKLDGKCEEAGMEAKKGRMDGSGVASPGLDTSVMSG